MASHNELGKKGEKIAIDFLNNNGYLILETSWRHNHKEIDIIALYYDILIFVEVKTRRTSYWGKPQEFVNIKKQKFLVEASESYINLKGFNGNSRFDVIDIVLNGDNYIVEHIINAFYPGV